jgi:hypothetical protein
MEVLFCHGFGQNVLMTPANYLWHRFILFASFFMITQATVTGAPVKMYDSSLLGSLSTEARYDKVSPEFMPYPQDFSNARFAFDQPASQNAAVSEEYVRNVLRTYFVVDGYDWRHTYSQSNTGVTGSLELPDRTRIRWLMRAGGLALLLYPDGGVIYLAREITTNWKTVAKTRWANVRVERKLYQKDGSERFFVHVCLTNISDETIAFAAEKRTAVFYPNQWVESQKTSRLLVNETRPIHATLNKTQTEALLASMKESRHADCSIISIKPRATYEYFISFNSGTKADWACPESS